VARKRGLSEKGLSALLAGSGLAAGKKETVDGEIRELPVDIVQRGKYQPRREMDAEALQELADSIRQQGVIQPILVRPVAEGRYEIIAGERRWRATQLAGLDRVPALIRCVDDNAAVAMALIENIQRENLNAMEEAMALQRLSEEFELTQAEVAESVGKSRSTVTNLLRLLNLTTEVRLMLENGDLEMGHGRAMLSLAPEQQVSVARQVEARSMSVRQTEALVRKLLESADKPNLKQSRKLDPDIKRLQENMSQKLGAAVKINHTNKGKGKLVISYNSVDELDGILAHIK
jgi:ParB family chromosome partitioning protein